MPACDESAHYMRPDKASASGYKDIHRDSLALLPGHTKPGEVIPWSLA